MKKLQFIILLPVLLHTGCGTYWAPLQPADLDWGSGVRDPDYVQAIVGKLISSRNPYNRLHAEGLVLVMTWEQACKACSTTRSESASRHLLIGCLLGLPQSAKRLAGISREDLRLLVGPPDNTASNQWLYAGYKCEVYAYPEYVCKYTVSFDDSGKLHDISSPTYHELMPGPEELAKLRGESDDINAEPPWKDPVYWAWGKGVMNSKDVGARAERFFRDTTIIGFYLAEGMLLAITWEEGCHLYSISSPWPHIRKTLHGVLFCGIEPDKNRFIGLSREELKGLVGPPHEVRHNAWVYFETDEEADDALRAACSVVFDEEGTVQRVVSLGSH